MDCFYVSIKKVKSLRQKLRHIVKKSTELRFV